MGAIKAIHVGCRQLGISEEDRRDLYARVTGKRSLTDMTPKEQETVLTELRLKGFKPASRNARKGKMQGPYAPKLQALWIGAWNLGITRSRRDEALIAFIKRQTGIDHTRFLRYAEDAEKVIEALKAWMAREGGVDWSNDKRFTPRWLVTPGAKIAAAQWGRLYPEGFSRRGRIAFSREVLQISGRMPNGCGHHDWIAVMNAFGKRIRERQLQTAEGAPSRRSATQKRLPGSRSADAETRK